jgi:hypothetical protein
VTAEAFVVQVPHSAALRAINYRPEVEAFRLRGAGRSRTLGRMAAEIGSSYWAVFTRLDCNREHGVELLSQTDMFAAEPAGRVIRRDSMPRPEKHLVRRWDILIAGAGQMHDGTLFGRSIIADGRLVDGYLGPHAVALRFEDAGGPENMWAYAFLNTRAGMAAVKSCAFGTSVPALRLDLLADLPIPLADPATMSRVSALVRTTVEERERYVANLATARAAVEGLPEMQQAHAMCADRKARTTSWSGALPTICAWNFASTGEAFSYLKSKWDVTVGDLIPRSGIFAGRRFARRACEPPHGIDLASQRDVFLMRRFPQRVARPPFPDEVLFSPPECLLIACDGQFSEGSLFGRTELAAAGLSGMAITQHMLRLMAPPELSPFLYSYLTSTVGHRLLKSTAVGTSVPSMRIDLVERLPVPSPRPDLLKTCKLAIDSALAARARADQAEQESTRIIEEEVLPQWLA